jgi:lantibiotic biosynthesis protein
VSWRPILEGSLAERSAAVEAEIAQALAGERGAVGDVALYWAYRAAIFEDDSWTAEQRDAAIARLAQRIEAGYARDALFGGAAGVGWLVAHITDDGEPVLRVIDELVLAALAVERWPRTYDLVDGLVGLGVYLLERETPEACRGLERIVDHLEQTAVHDGPGITWFTPPEQIPVPQLQAAPGGYYNCGLAHGVPGAIALLARIVERTGSATAAALRDRSCRWLLHQRGRAGANTFPAQVTPDGHAAPARTAWCYGDPGVIVALWRAGVREPDLANACLARSAEEAHVWDAGFCHGAAGLAHIANRLFHASGDTRFREHAVRWFEAMLELRRPEGIAGFGAYSAATRSWQPRLDLIEGVTGIGLALLAAISAVDPDWDRQLLCDLPVIDLDG